ncbi:uncharacterized protein FA14DRAFT_180647 [Meira miltonrushii]|uniref:DUF3818 domain-containing protein n=1 Tax=Meira miltonrushii TaxID=1280837 RepID=A0A316V9S1_9BASI|nr:uncharacterized protein FA14DRAFT_180647 [Meira miltonrushii]PWN34014.1 hypothetical protein FA14DRAFT_180647 [Meira miltonrushii]
MAKENGDASIVNGTTVALTKTQRHYLLKLLVCAEMHDEWSLLDEKGGLQQYGAPFLSGQKAPAKVGEQKDLYKEHACAPVILLHLFHVHLRRFPGLDRAKKDYWQKNIVPFFDRLADSHLSNSAERAELTNRKVLNVTATRYFSTFFARGVGLRGTGEERGPGKGMPGSEAWGAGKQWGRGTVKRGLECPIRPTKEDKDRINNLFPQTDDIDGASLWQAGSANTQRIKYDWSAWKESIIESETGLDETILQLQTKFMKNLPDQYRNAAEWVRRHVAFVVWTILCKYPGGDEIFGIIKTLHFLFPYWGAKQLLKIANAQKMIKAIIDFILARPLGAVDSLGQRIFFTIMSAEISKINKKLLTPLRKVINDADACKALEEYVSKRTTQKRSELLLRAKKENCDFLVVVLREYGYGKMDEITSAQSDYVQSALFTNVDWAYPDSCREAKYLDPLKVDVQRRVQSAPKSAIKFAHLKLYLRELLRKRDREKVEAIGTGPLLPRLLRESLEIVFYKLFYDIALAANLSARLQDFQNFIDDLIKVKTQMKDTLEDYIALCARHEGYLYLFVHEIRDAVKPVFDWCQSALDFMALSTTDPWNPSNQKAPKVEVNLDEMLEEAGKQDGVNIEMVLDELKSLEDYIKIDKIKTEVAMRKEYALIHDDAVTNVTLCQYSKGGLLKGLQTDDTRVQPSSQTKQRLENLDGLMTELLEQAGLKPDKGQIAAEGIRGTDTAQVPWGFYTPEDVLMQQYAEKIKGLQITRSYQIDGIHIPPPTIPNIRSLLPAFRAQLSQCLPDWANQAKDTPPIP